MPSPHRSLVCGFVLVALLSTVGCSSAPQPTPRPSPPAQSAIPGGGPTTAFPDVDTPIAKVTGTQRTYWSPYEVVIVPGAHTTDSIPPPPRAVNDSPLPDVVAQGYAQAFYRAQAWRRWGTKNAQADFLHHLGADPFDMTSAFLNGSQVQVPDCAVYPTSVVVVSTTGLTLQANGDSYALEVTYGGPCQVQSVAVDGTVDSGKAFQDTATFLSVGWLQSDPLLGEIWSPDAVLDCTDQLGRACPTPVAETQPATALPGLPEADTPIGQASAALQAVWGAYDVLNVPGRAVVAGLPQPPAADNRTDGEVPDALAQRWALAVVRDQAWWRWSWQAVQLAFQSHVTSNSRDSNNTLAAATGAGAKPVLPDCATFPSTLQLHAISASERGGLSSDAQRTQYAFTATWATPCAVSARYPDGSSQAQTLVTSLNLYGQLRIDPVLGELWYPLLAVPPN